MSKKSTAKAGSTSPAASAASAPVERVTIPLTAELSAQIAEWTKLKAWLDKAKDRENELRLIIAKAAVPAPAEGMNTVYLGDFEVKVGQPINRTIDLQLLDGVMNQLPAESNARNIGVLIEYKPKLILDGFRALNDTERKIFSQALTEKPGTPTLDIHAAPPLIPEAPPISTGEPPAAPAKKKSTKKGKK